MSLKYLYYFKIYEYNDSLSGINQQNGITFTDSYYSLFYRTGKNNHKI